MQTYLTYLPIALVLAIYVARMLEVGTKRAVIKGPVQEKTTFRLFMASGLIAAFGGIFEYIWTGMHIHWLLLGLGVVLGLLSFAIRRAAIAALGQFWSLHIEIRDDHQFVRSGPFRWMRHPTYFSMILELLSATLILCSGWAGLCALVIFIPALIRRLRTEEKAMVIKFGEKYQTYQRQTPILFPLRVP